MTDVYENELAVVEAVKQATTVAEAIAALQNHALLLEESTDAEDLFQPDLGEGVYKGEAAVLAAVMEAKTDNAAHAALRRHTVYLAQVFAHWDGEFGAGDSSAALGPDVFRAGGIAYWDAAWHEHERNGERWPTYT